MTKYEMACAIADAFNLPSSHLRPVSDTLLNLWKDGGVLSCHTVGPGLTLAPQVNFLFRTICLSMPGTEVALLRMLPGLIDCQNYPVSNQFLCL